MQITMATPPLNRMRELHFVGLIFVVCQLTAKIGPLENFPLYSSYKLVLKKVQTT